MGVESLQRGCINSVREAALRKWRELGFVFIVGLSAGVGVDRILNQASEKPPSFPPFVYVGDGYFLERVEEDKFKLVDTRSGNTLPPDRMRYLYGIAQQIQDDSKCRFADIQETVDHAMLISVLPDCLVEGINKMQSQTNEE